jgi:protein SCO1/2
MMTDHNSMRKLLLLMAVMLAGCGGNVDSLPYFTVASNTPVWDSDSDIRSVARFALTDQQGSTITNEELRGAPYVASFFFVSCTNICPTLRSRLTSVADSFHETEVKILSHSVTPQLDTVDKLAAYSAVNNIEPAQWKLLTGKREEILDLARYSYGAELRNYSSPDAAGTEFLHTETVFLVDGEGRVRGIYNGTLQSEINLLKKDINTLLGRAVG